MLNYYRYSPFYFCPQDKVSTSEVTKVKQADFKVKQAEVTKLGGVGQLLFRCICPPTPPPPLYSGSHLQQAAPQRSAHGKYVLICNEVIRIRNSMFCFAHCPFNNCLMFSFELTGGGVLQPQPTNVQARGRDQETKRTRPSSNYHDKT